MVLALEKPSRAAVRTAQVTSPRTITADAHTDAEGKGFGTPPDVRIASVAAKDTLDHAACRKPDMGGESSKDCSAYFEALASPLVNSGSYSHQLQLPCYAELRVRAGVDLQCPACRATVT